jgi:flagellar assembly factor FliW
MIDPSLGLPTISMAVPMPGFPAHREFVLVRLNEDGLLYAFTSIQDPELRFPRGPAGAVLPGLRPGDRERGFRGPEHQGPRRLLLMTVITAGVDETTANLLAPIVVDRDSMRAMQVVLSGSGYPVRAIMHRAY